VQRADDLIQNLVRDIVKWRAALRRGRSRWSEQLFAALQGIENGGKLFRLHVLHLGIGCLEHGVVQGLLGRRGKDRLIVVDECGHVAFVSGSSLSAFMKNQRGSGKMERAEVMPKEFVVTLGTA